MRARSISIFLLALANEASAAAVPRVAGRDIRHQPREDGHIVSSNYSTPITTGGAAQPTTSDFTTTESIISPDPIDEPGSSDTPNASTDYGSSVPPVLSTFTVSEPESEYSSASETHPLAPESSETWSHTPEPTTTISSITRGRGSPPDTQTTTQPSLVVTTWTTIPKPSDECTPLDDGQMMTVVSVIWDATTTISVGSNFTHTYFDEPVIPTYCDGDDDDLGGGRESSSEPASWRSLPPHPTDEVITHRPAPSTFTSVPPMKSDSLARPQPTDDGNAPNIPAPEDGGGRLETITKSKSPTKSIPTPLIGEKDTTTLFTRVHGTKTVLKNTQGPEWIQTGTGSDGSRRVIKESPKVAVKQPAPSFTVTGETSRAIINDHTFTIPATGSTVVSVDRGQFTINPTEIVGHGHTIAVPNPVKPAGPSAAAVGDKAEPPAAQLTNRAVAGGELLTAIGPTIMILRSTTFTYGPGISKTTVEVGDDRIFVEESGITIHGKTLGGPQAATQLTKFEIVGGALVTKLSPGVVGINGETITIRPKMDETITEIGGETLTIGPKGVMHRDITIAAASTAAVTTTFQPGGDWGTEFPEETGKASAGKDSENSNNDGSNSDNDDDDDDAGSIGRPDLTLLSTAFGIAIGVWVWM